MQTRTTNVPATIRERDGKWFVVVVSEGVEIEAPLSAWMIGRIHELVIAPRLRGLSK